MSLIELDNIDFTYGRGEQVLHGVSLTVTEGRSLGLVGQSGSGKSTILKLLLGLERPSAGRMTFEGEEMRVGSASYMRGYRRQVQAVYQDPYASLDPRQKVMSIVAEPLKALKIAGDHRKMVGDALESVGLERDITDRYPHQFSGGQRQRIAIARAIVAGPKLLLADEAVSALDLSTRVKVVELFQALEHEMTLLFVSHDLGVVAALCDDIAILEAGRLVEAGPTRQILAAPQHPYTQHLLESVPRLPETLK